VARWARLAEVVTAEAVTTWQHLVRQGRWRLAWWLSLPAAAIVTGLISLPGHPIAAIGLLATALALLCRFTRPITSLLVGTGVAIVAVVWPSTTLSAFVWSVSVLPAYAVGRHVSHPHGRRAMVALTLATGARSVANLVDPIAGGELHLVEAGLFVVDALLLVVLPGAIGMLQGERARAMDALHERNALLERANLLGEAQARMQERARITAEMHDLLGHRLSLSVLYAGALEMRTRDAAPEISKQADLLRATSRTALDELRAALGILRLDGADPPYDSESVVGAREDVVNLVTEARDAGLPITLSWHGDDLTDTDLHVRRAVNRIVREALTNVHKHAPGAPTRLAVTVDTGKLTIDVRNAARPPTVPPPGSGLGLAGLRERVRLAGGDFTAGKDPITGDHSVTAELPLRHGGPDGMSRAVDPSALADWQMLLPHAGTEDVSVHRASRTRRPLLSKTHTAFLAIFGVAVVLLGGLGLGISYYSNLAVSPKTYQQIKIGDTQDRVRELTGGDSTAAREAVKAAQPVAPAGTACEYAFAGGFESVFRFCFKDGKLALKDEIRRL
jgi:signal transduction histidine kinase